MPIGGRRTLALAIWVNSTLATLLGFALYSIFKHCSVRFSWRLTTRYPDLALTDDNSKLLRDTFIRRRQLGVFPAHANPQLICLIQRASGRALMRIEYRSLLATTATLTALISWGALSARQTGQAEPVAALARASTCTTFGVSCDARRQRNNFRRKRWWMVLGRRLREKLFAGPFRALYDGDHSTEARPGPRERHRKSRGQGCLSAGSRFRWHGSFHRSLSGDRSRSGLFGGGLQIDAFGDQNLALNWVIWCVVWEPVCFRPYNGLPLSK